MDLEPEARDICTPEPMANVSADDTSSQWDSNRLQILVDYYNYQSWSQVQVEK